MPNPPFRVKVRWTEDIKVENLERYKERDNDHLYLIIRRRKFIGIPARKIFYIGMAYKQSVVDRLGEHHKLPKILANELRRGKGIIRIGQIILPRRKRMNIQIVRDVESALIFDHQPEYNEMSISSYRGRPIAIINKGKCKPLRKRIRSIDWERRKT